MSLNALVCGTNCHNSCIPSSVYSLFFILKEDREFLFLQYFFPQWGAIASSRKPDLQRCVLKHS